ncbi:MAG: hypothetical protein QOE28_624 [Solirubrobacteraceae bacterium]|nr:hypothetical protein [Solirubrobacteraceae bacterium]
MRDWGLLAGGLFALVVGLASLVTGGGERGLPALEAWLVIAFALTLLVNPLSRMTGRAPRPRTDRVEHGGVLAAATVLDGSRRRQLGTRAAAFMFTVVGVLMGISGAWLGFVCAAFFGALFVLSFVTMRKPFRLTFLPDGLQVETGAAPAFVPWDGVSGVGITSISGAQLLSLDGPVEMTRAQRRLARVGRLVSDHDLEVPLEVFGVAAETLADAVSTYAGEPGTRTEIGTPAALRRLGLTSERVSVD